MSRDAKKIGWKSLVGVLCVIGFFKEFRPSDPFISPFLNGPHRNFTEEQINHEIFPIGTYANLGLLVIVFLLTDWLRYKPVILIGGVAGIITWTILPLAKNLRIVQVSQFFYGLFCASEVAYYSYMYAKLDKKHYQRATSLTKTLILLGKASSGLSSQVLLHFCLTDYLGLHYITLGALVLSTICSIFMPSVSARYPTSAKSVKAIQESPADAEGGEGDKLTGKNGNVQSKEKDYFKECSDDKSKMSILDNFAIIYKNFRTAIKDKNVIKWSLWWSASLCGYLQVLNYIQLLWQSIINNGDRHQPLYHGYISTAHCIIGAICTYLVGFLKLRWDLYGEIVLAICSIIQGSLIVHGTQVDVLLKNYILFISFRAIHQSSNTIASSEVARHIHSDSYAVVFGVNTFFGLLGQSILTIIVIQYLKLDIRTQFLLYGSYYIVIGSAFALSGCYTLFSHFRTKDKKSKSPA